MKTPHPLHVLVYGATGSQQGPVVPALLAAGHRAYALTHSPDKAAALEQAGARAVVADMADAEGLRRASEGMDAVALLVPFILANPHDAVTYAKNAIDAARQAGVKLLVWNTSGFLLPTRVGNPALDSRLDVAEYLRESGVPHIILQPSVYAENLLGPWTAPFVAEHDQVAYPTPAEFGAILDQLYGPGAGDGAVAVYQGIHDTKQYPPMHADMAPVLAKLPVTLTPIAEWVHQFAPAFTPTAVPQ
jgi:uncharacterized protein YbjT (DUF2867 family)